MSSISSPKAAVKKKATKLFTICTSEKMLTSYQGWKKYNMRNKMTPISEKLYICYNNTAYFLNRMSVRLPRVHFIFPVFPGKKRRFFINKIFLGQYHFLFLSLYVYCTIRLTVSSGKQDQHRY